MVQSRIKRDLGSSRSARCAAVFCASIVCMAGAASAQQPAEDTRAARVAAEQQEKAKHLKPYEPNKAEVWVAKLEEQFITGSLHWHPFFTSAYARRRVHARRRLLDPRQRLQHDRRARQLHVQRLQADRERVPRAAAVRPPRPALGPRRLARGHRRSASTASARPTRQGRPRQLQLPAAVRSATLDVRPDATRCSSAAASSTRSGTRARAKAARRRSRRSTRPPRCRAWAPGRPTCTRRARSALDWRTVRRATRGAAATTASTLHDYADQDDVYSFRQVDYEAIQHIPILRDAWVLSLRGRVETTYADDDDAGPVLHAAGARRRLEPARLRELALPRSAQPAAAGRMARARQQLLRHGASSTTPARSRPARVGPRLRRPEERLRHRLPPARPGGDAAAHRAREEQRRASSSSSRRKAAF